MKLNATQLEQLAQIAIKASRQAGAIIKEASSKHIDVFDKEGGSTLASQVFTETDIKAENIIKETLTPTLKEYDLAMLSEETPDDEQRLHKDYFWCIDPMDGTLSFINGKPGYSVCIGLVQNDGTPAIGVIYDPVNDNLYHAINNQGVFKNNTPWRPTTNGEFNFICDGSFQDHPVYTSLKETLYEEYSELKWTDHGGAAMSAIWVMESQNAVYFKLPKKTKGGGCLWDFAASACIANEVGITATDYFGQPLQLNRKGTTFMNKEGVIYASSNEVADTIRQLVEQCEKGL
jgi:3'-phosphoadenosine 5'-phosphosulfate (PAPS) 3'-phosphatase